MQRKNWPTRVHVKGVDHEWVGGRLTAPFYITEPEPFRPDLILWYEIPPGRIVDIDVVDPALPVTLGESLLQVMREPKSGAPRRPKSIRVCDAKLAAEIRAVAEDIPIRVAPTPELDQIIQDLASRNPPRETASYFERGRVPAESVAKLFFAARHLWTMAPWKAMYDGQIIRLDVPEYNVHGAAISIIGNRKESIGFLLFPSLDGYKSFERFAEQYRDAERIDFGTTVLSLNYKARADLPESMRREVARYEWPIAGPRAHPVALHRDRDGLQRPLSQQDIDLLAATALALGTFYARNEAILRHEVQEPVAMTISDDNDLDVRFTYPYEAFAVFGEQKPPPRSGAPARRIADPVQKVKKSQPSLPLFIQAPRPAARVTKVGRNEPCPCGSGKKYKHCHLEEDEGACFITPARVGAFADMNALAPVPPRLQNTDGDDLLVIVDRFEFAPKRRDAIAERLASMDGVEGPDQGATKHPGELEYVFIRSATAKQSILENTVIGRVTLGASTLSIETNSERWSKDLRRKVEKQFKKWIHYSSQQEESIEVVVVFDGEDKDQPREPKSAEMLQVAREWKQNYYRRWLDESIPALGGKTPRQASRLVRGRKNLEVLLKDIEQIEARLPEAERINIDALRVELGLRS